MGGSEVGGQCTAMRSVIPVDGTELVPDDFRLWVDPGGPQVSTSCLVASQYLSVVKVKQVMLPANPDEISERAV